MDPLFSNKNTLFIFAGIITVYFIGLFVDIMDIDAAQYASISREMLETKSFLILKNRGQDYLDKPPLLFWLSSMSFKLFGFYNWSYKLPSLLFALLAIFSTYKLAKLYYDEDTSILAAIILATCQAFFLITNDCRTDTILTGSVIFSISNIAAYLKKGGWQNFLLGFTGVGLGLLAKGPIGLVVPVFALGIDTLLKRKFNLIFKPEWLLGLLIVGIILLPMCVGLYLQYGMEGLKFYFWTQSFGRITGESQWRSNGGFFFMFHSFLWSFLPWSLFSLGALFERSKYLLKNKLKLPENEEFITTGGSLLSYASLSMSKYQLPHYIYVFFPLAAVATSAFIIKIWREENFNAIKKTYVISTCILSAVLWIIAGILVFVVFEGSVIQIILFVSLILGTVYFLVKRKGLFTKIIYTGILTAIGVNFFMNSYIYPSLLKYQPTHELGIFFNEKVKAGAEIFTFDTYQSHSLDFYTGMIIPEHNNNVPSLTKDKTYYCLTNAHGLEKLQNASYNCKIVKEFSFYPVTKVTLKFLNPSLRQSVLDKRILTEIRP